ncbi:MAG: cytochrome c-type biogenesis CcmF C-terminal domain-containing protein [Dehalococcoidia bacterium]
MVDIGHVALILAFILTLYTLVASVIASRTGSRAFADSARNSILVIAALYTLALVILAYEFVTKDFNLKIVAENASEELSGLYSFSAIYASKSGSVFFWGWLLAVFSALFALQKHTSHSQIMPRASAVLAIILAFFLALVTLVSNVFAEHTGPSSHGMGMNPLLQNFGMIIHPPLQYIGFAAFTIVFAFVMGTLITYSRGTEWIGAIRRWTLFAWCTLGIGNLVGMWWSYNELGWGGYWAWDPVENAGLMPWLLATAFLHSIALRRKKNYLTTWSFALAIATFIFVLLSPFTTHGGIESPLHGFYASSYVSYILAAILVTLAASVGLLCVRYGCFEKEEGPSSFISREGAFLLVNIVFVILVLIIIAGMIYPQLAEWLAGSNVAVETSYYNWACGPIMLFVVFFMGICPLLGWRKSYWGGVGRNLLYTLLPAVIAAIVILIWGIGNWYALAALVCGFPVFVIVAELIRGTVSRHRARGENYGRALLALIGSDRPRYGGFVAHIGIVLITLAIIGSSFYSVEVTAAMNTGNSIEVGDYEMTYDALVLEEDDSKRSAVATVSVKKGGSVITTMHPEYNYWFSAADAFSESAARTTAKEDVFVSLLWTSYDPEDKSALFRVLISPLIVWMWIGGGFLLLGGALSFWPERKRILKPGGNGK